MSRQRGGAPMAGDKAIYIGSKSKHLHGHILGILSNPIPVTVDQIMGIGRHMLRLGKLSTCYSSMNGHMSKYEVGQYVWWVDTRYLVRIPPDEEAKQLFKEDEMPMTGKRVRA